MKLLAILPLIFLAACNSGNIENFSNSKKLSRFHILEEGYINRGSSYAIIKDTETESEYLLVEKTGITKLK